MFKNLAVALALTAGLGAPVWAASDLGFESGDTSGWTLSGGATLSAVGSYSTNVVDEYDPGFVMPVSLSPVEGSQFGVLQMGPAPATSSLLPVSHDSTATLSLGAASRYGDVLYLRLLTADYFYSVAPSPGIPTYNDRVSVVYDGNGASPDVLSAADILNSGYTADSGWLGYALRPGTQQVSITLTNFHDIGGSNPPTLAIDFSAAPVPENSSFALMAAGLGVLALVGRRRQTSRA